MNSGQQQASTVKKVPELERIRRLMISETLRFLKATGYHHGAAPYGFEKYDGFLFAIPGEMAVVDKIYRFRTEGKSLRQIAAWLNQNNVPTRRGGKWGSEQVRCVLARPECSAYLADPKPGPVVVRQP